MSVYFLAFFIVHQTQITADWVRVRDRKKDRKKLQGKNIMTPYYIGRPLTAISPPDVWTIWGTSAH